MEMDTLTEQEHEPLLDESDGPEPQSAHAQHRDTTAYCERGIAGLLSSRYVTICALFSALGGLLFGFDQGLVSVILVEHHFVSRFWQIADSTPGSGLYKGFLTAMLEVGALIGAFNQGWIADKISRKYSIMAAAVIFLLGSILQTCAMDYATLVVGRTIGGVGIGMLSMVAPLYISEISPPEIRGTLLVLEELSIVIGIVVAFWTTYGTRLIDSEWSWRLPFALQALPGVVLGAGIYFLPFSPRWLVKQHREKDAMTSLCKLRQLPISDRRVMAEMAAIKAEVSAQDTIHAKHITKPDNALQLELALWSDLFSKEYWPRTRVAIGVTFFQQFVGINALIYYAPTMLKVLGLSFDMQLKMSGIINMAQLVGVATSLWTMDILGRRRLLLFGSAAMSACHLVIAVLVGKYSDDWSMHDLAGWTCVSLLLVYMLVFGATWGPVPWALPSEIFPMHVRAKGVALAACSNWANNAIVGLLTPPLVQQSGYGAYLFFAFFCLCSLLWTYFYVPETSGKSLEEMTRVFDNRHES